jgi:hypothetical protein
MSENKEKSGLPRRHFLRNTLLGGLAAGFLPHILSASNAPLHVSGTTHEEGDAADAALPRSGTLTLLQTRRKHRILCTGTERTGAMRHDYYFGAFGPFSTNRFGKYAGMQRRGLHFWR